MRLPRRPSLVVLLVVLSSATLSAQSVSRTTAYHAWWHDRNVGQPLNAPNAKQLPLIRVQGNKFVQGGGEAVLFRGLSISDPDKIEHQGVWNKQLFQKVKETGAMIVRIPVHPVSWRERTPQQYLLLLDQAVEWCTELGMYVLIDWHSIGNLEMELFQDPMYTTTRSETYEFWRTIARHFAGHNTPAFFELFNEPTLYFGQLGRMSWSEWKRINEDIITVIRAYDADKIPLVAGFDWAYDLTPLLMEPIAAEGIGYVSHPYPHKRGTPFEPKWEENFGFAASTYPVLVTEFGFTLGKETLAENGEYGRAIIAYLEGKGIGWMAWVFDPEWTPRLITSWESFQLTESGEFFRRAMRGEIR